MKRPSRSRTDTPRASARPPRHDYEAMYSGVVELLETARRTVARSVNTVMTATYWEIGRRIVELEQGGRKRAGYGTEMISRLATDLSARFGRGFSRQNLQRFRELYLAFGPEHIRSTLSGKLLQEPPHTPSSSSMSSRAVSEHVTSMVSRTTATFAGFAFADLMCAFPLPWSHYVLLLSRTRSAAALNFYHTEALRGGWSVRQLARQIGSQFYERTALSRNKAAMLTKGARATPEDLLTADEEIRDPLVLGFLNLRDEYSEQELEGALIEHLETFLLELGDDFAFVGRQRRLRIDDEWYRVDLVFFHRGLRCLVIVDLKLDRFTQADVGQMHLYLNYARAHWMRPGENPPVGLILCASKGEALVRYATEGLPNQMLVREYLTALPNEQLLAKEIAQTRKRLEERY
jgi:predicted nuclease of restriction endonuclease-like (RecB) superfamily